MRNRQDPSHRWEPGGGEVGEGGPGAEEGEQAMELGGQESQSESIIVYLFVFIFVCLLFCSFNQLLFVCFKYNSVEMVNYRALITSPT